MTRRMLRSVVSISLVLIVGWMLSSAARNPIVNFTKYSVFAIVQGLIQDQNAASATASNILNALIGFYTCIYVATSGAGAPILIISKYRKNDMKMGFYSNYSSEYRNAYKESVSRMFERKWKNSVKPILIVNRIANKGNAR